MALLSIKALVGLGNSAGFSGLLLGTFVSEDLACLAAGFLVANGTVSYPVATLACLLGIFLGDLGLFFVGRWFGESAFTRVPLRWLMAPAQVEQARQLFDRRGAALILGSRFAPGSRLPVYVAAGLLKQPIRRFCLYFGIGALLWTPALVGLAVLFGDAMIAAYEAYGLWALPSLVVGALVLLGLTRWLPQFFTWKGRRMLLGQWQRLTRWEYWPWWVIYAPLVPWFLWLAFVRYRHPLAFTAVNPAMPFSGIVGESKAEILAGLAAGGAVPPWVLLPAGECLEARLARVEAFAQEHGWPVVLKPDAGERGSGVSICRDATAAEAALAEAKGDFLAQRFAPGNEYGVFYIRRPDEAKGVIFGIVEKQFTSVIGDGHRSLEELILADERARANAKFFFRKHVGRLLDVPDAGETVVLAELGTHARGALFLDGSHLATPELTSEIDRISQHFTGFHLGRYDIRCPSETDLRAGRELAVLELNGVTSEPTWMYDPGYELQDAHRLLREQWSAAFAIGAANARAGARVAKVAELLSLMFNRKKTATKACQGRTS